MIKALIGLLLSLWGVSAVASTSAMSELSQLLKPGMTYQAVFNQQTAGPNHVITQKNSGKVYIHYPGRFRWESKQPTDQVLIVNGNQVWIYDKDLAQVVEQTLNTNINSIAALLTGSIKEIAQHFTIKSIKSRKNHQLFELTPKKKSEYAAMSKAVLEFSRKRLLSIEVSNDLSGVTYYYFSNIQLNKPLKASLFTFTVPAGVDVLKQ